MIYSHSCVSSLCAPIKYSISPKRHVRQSVTPIMAQGFRDHEGPRSSKDVVDSNLSVMRERMKEIRVKEILERCYRSDTYGWNSLKVVDFEEENKVIIKRSELSSLGQNVLTGLLELAMIVGGSLGFTFFTGTFFLCVVSLFVHLNSSLI